MAKAIDRMGSENDFTEACYAQGVSDALAWVLKRGVSSSLKWVIEHSVLSMSQWPSGG